MATRSLIVERDVEATMRDGVILRADIYRPATSEPLPVLLQRTPYNKAFSGDIIFALTAAERGYAVVIQDTRGRWASEGETSPYIHPKEKSDGYDTVEWAAHQPWANGKVGMFGGSYVGYTQLAAAAMQPPALKTIIPAIALSDPSHIPYSGGALTLGVLVSWGLMAQAAAVIAQRPDNDPQKAGLMSQCIASLDGMATAATFKHLPLQDMPLLGHESLTPILGDALAHGPGDDFWQRLRCAHKDLTIPIFHIGGWYDIFIASTMRDFGGIRDAGNTQQKALIGPWLHGPMSGLVGEVDFGIQASDLFAPAGELYLRWFDYWLKGIENGVMDEPPVRIFVMGDNCWRNEQEWPLARTQYMPCYLHSGGAANTLHGDGVLSFDAPADEPVDAFVYDPRHPVPTRGGGLCCWDAALPPGAYDQREIETRPDVLVYSTPPLEHDLEVTGPMKVHLWAATSAPDTDFTAKLVDVGPCGYARNVQDGIIRARYRRSMEQAELVKPGEVYEYVIDLAATSNVFKAGHRLRLEISSSNFPHYDRNPNTGHPIGVDADLRPAFQTIFHDAAHPSHIVLPVIPRI